MVIAGSQLAESLAAISRYVHLLYQPFVVDFHLICQLLGHMLGDFLYHLRCHLPYA